MWNQGPDLRLSVTGYRFEVGSPVYGINAGAELKSRDGMFVLKYQVGNDKLNRTYQTVGAFVNVGVQLENLAKGESPLTMPEPIFRSPRNLRRLLADKVKRNFHQAVSALVAQAEQGAQQAGQDGQATPGPTPLFTRTAVIGIVPEGGSNFAPLNPAITAADVAGVSYVVITWTGPAAPTNPRNFQLVDTIDPQFASAPAFCNGNLGSTGLTVNNPAFWTPGVNGPWNSFTYNDLVGEGTQNIGTVTLSFFP